MARRKSYRRRVYTRARRGYRRRKGFLTGNIGNIVIGAGAGVASNMIPQFIGQYTNPAVFAVAGYYFKKPALMGIAGYELGKMFSPFGNGAGAGFKGQGD